MKRLMIAASALSLLTGAGLTTAASAQPYHGDRYDRHDRFDRHDRWAHHEWRRGGRIDFRDWRRGRVIDYRRYHLRRPPRGYEWRDVDGNYVLAAIAGGIIADLISH
jgi:Ni/Co efflux regulator RcnB